MSLIGAYLPPISLDSLPDFEEALTRFNGYRNIAAAGDFNADIHDLTQLRNQTLAACFAAHGLFDLLHQRRPFLGSAPKMWLVTHRLSKSVGTVGSVGPITNLIMGVPGRCTRCKVGRCKTPTEPPTGKQINLQCTHPTRSQPTSTAGLYSENTNKSYTG
jgi:hypothetical protein